MTEIVVKYKGDVKCQAKFAVRVQFTVLIKGNRGHIQRLVYDTIKVLIGVNGSAPFKT